MTQLESHLPAAPNRLRLVSALGITQIFAWGSTFYLPAVLASPIARDTGWSLSAVVGGLSWGMLVAGLCSPIAGRLLDRHGGRVVLAFSSLMLSAGLLLMSTASSLWVYYLSWSILGLGMATGLYDSAFATLGTLLGERARGAITGLTLIGGFASTAGWPAMAALESWCGWRETCWVLAAVHAVIGLPIHWLAVPKPVNVTREVPKQRQTALAEDRSTRQALLVSGWPADGHCIRYGKPFGSPADIIAATWDSDRNSAGNRHGHRPGPGGGEGAGVLPSATSPSDLVCPRWRADKPARYLLTHPRHSMAGIRRCCTLWGGGRNPHYCARNTAAGAIRRRRLRRENGSVSAANASSAGRRAIRGSVCAEWTRSIGDARADGSTGRHRIVRKPQATDKVVGLRAARCPLLADSCSQPAAACTS